MIYTFDSRIRFSEVDDKGFLKFDSFINYFQDCTTFQSEDLGIGIEHLRKKHRVWVISSWQIDILRYPRLLENITIGTFAYDFKSFLGYRNFFIKDEQGEYVAKASSIWAFLNTDTGRPEKADPDDMALYGSEERLDMDYKSRRIVIPDNLKKLDPIEVKPYHLDVNNHVNNGQYINMAFECLSEKKMPEHIRVEYRNQARLHDIIHPYTDGTIVDLRSNDDTSYCVIELT
ncbi:MAG: thioesterase [Lachnospiraceae bacterium]|nr:thioesterase [Lachnospiraceae bacterium]